MPRRKTDALWEAALSEIEKHHDITDTKICLHGDGAAWIKAGLEWLPNCTYVLGPCHKGKYASAVFAPLPPEARETYEAFLRQAPLRCRSPSLR